LCGNEIEWFIDGTRWVNQAVNVGETFVPEWMGGPGPNPMNEQKWAGPFHMKCMEHADLWNAINETREEIKKREVVSQPKKSPRKKAEV
jgi:hypothetical protein